MTKKMILILVGVALTIGVLGTAGYVYAQVGGTPETDPPAETESDMKSTNPFQRGGHWLSFGAREGILSEYLLEEVAKIFGLSDEEIATFDKVKDIMMGIKEKYSIEEIREMMKEAFTSAVNAALADEVITQEQADRMLERIKEFGECDFRAINGRDNQGRIPRQDLEHRIDGLLGQYMELAIADALGLTIEEFQALKTDEGFNIIEYGVEQGMTVEELQEWMQEVYTTAINAALEDGAITQDQADRMLEQLESPLGRMPFSPMNTNRGRGW